ncbi:MAG: MBL fold metallo-hydrolase [Chloroflexi bacterium]|nr:MBL fold metallo-hydrolase [Chloroflexota bacterium]
MPDFRPITPHIWRLNLEWDFKIPFVPPIPVAVWLVKDGDEWTLIDAGTPLHESAIINAVAHFLKTAAPARVALTHAHYDHGGAMSAIVKRWNIPIWAHTAEADFVTGAQEYRNIVSGSLIFNLAKSMLGQRVWRLPVARALQEGETFGGLEVIHVPGHTPGMAAFHHRADRAIICGDTFMNMGGRLTEPFSMATPEPEEARRSIKKLAALDFDVLLPSHDTSQHGVPAETARQLAARL